MCHCQKTMYYNCSNHQNINFSIDSLQNDQTDTSNMLRKPLLNRLALSVESDDGEIRTIHICDDTINKSFKTPSPYPIGDLNVDPITSSGTMRLSALLRSRPSSFPYCCSHEG